MKNNILKDYKSREIRVFISSTFRDMMKEREHLVKKIFPQLRKKYREHAVTIVEVDLRWGVLEEEAKGGKVIDICLSEVDKSRPYFIGLVGERYGWIPDKSEYEKHKIIIENYNWIKEDIARGLSITEMEIQYGVLRNEKMWERSFFYLRDSENEDSKNYKENETSVEYSKLKILKESIINNHQISSKDYSNIKEFGGKLFNDLSKIIEKDFHPISEHDKDIIPQLDLISNFTKVYEVDEKLIQMIESKIIQANKPIVITGQYGVGKSSLLSYFTTKLSERFDNIFFNFSNSNVLARNPVEIIKRFAIEVEINHNLLRSGNADSDLENNAEQLLYKIENSKETFVFIIDDLDSIKLTLSNSFFNLLIFLSSLENVTVIVSAENESIKKRFEWQESEFVILKNWPKNIQRNFINKYLSLYSKKIPNEKNIFLSELKNTDLPIVMKSYLNELIRYGEFETLDSQIDKYAKCETEIMFYKEILIDLENEFSDNKLDLEIILSATALSRYGILELDLFEMCNTSRMNFNYIFNSIISEMCVIDGRYKIENRYLMEAVADRYLNNQVKIDDAVKRTVIVISNHGKDGGNLVNEDTNEIGHLLSLSMDDETLIEYLSEMNMIWWLYHEDIYLLMKLWFKVINVKSPEDIYTIDSILNFFDQMVGWKANSFQKYIGLKNFVHILELLNCYNGAKKIYEYILIYLEEPMESEIDIQSIKIIEESYLANSMLKLEEFDKAEVYLNEVYKNNCINDIESLSIKVRYLSLMSEVFIAKNEAEKAEKYLMEIDLIFENNQHLVQGDVDEFILKALETKMKHFESYENYEIAEELSAFLMEKSYSDKGEYSTEYLEILIEHAKYQALNEKLEDSISSFCEAEITAGKMFGKNNNRYIDKINKLTKKLGI